MPAEDQEAIVVILTAIAMCGGAGALWLWSDRSNKALLLIGGLWLVIGLAGLVIGPPWDVGVMAATVLLVLLLVAASYAAGGWRR
ncbi:hypothetical protein [Paracoccus xiamenensis]|uniref:hypothetical protein n=1 Tax=Paracoccus xiamenensis TaxID=2714901 RepID=UPI00140ADA2A|nr:hypothetical protein [Paracoccus xiamenensis]NHF73637.1 hypothetical protein [Paracoccus xiamenensis]